MNPFLLHLIAWAKVNAATPAAMTAGQGVVSAYVGAGDYTMTLDRPLDELNGICLAVCRTIDFTVAITHTTDAAKQILTRTVAGAAGDCAFDFVALRLG